MAITAIQLSKLTDIWGTYEEAKGVKPAPEEYAAIYAAIPGDVKGLAQEYGWGDEEVQEALFLHFDA